MKRSILALTLSLFAPALSAQSVYDLFVKEYDQAVKFKNKDGITKAIRTRPGPAITHFEALLVSKLRSSKPEQYDATLENLRTGFKAAFEVDTLEQVERYYSRINVDKINQLYKAEEQRTKLYNEFVKLKNDRDRNGILELTEQGLKLGRYLEELGHKLKAADVYSSLASFVNVIPNRTDKDKKDTIDYAKMFMQMRDSWNWNKDTTYLQWKNWVKATEVTMAEAKKETDKRKKAGLDEAASGFDRFIKKDAESIIGKLQFEALKQLPDDSCFLGGAVPVNWLSVRVEDKPAKMAWFKKSELYLVRDGNKVGVSITGRADALQRVTAAGKPKPSVFHLDPAKKQPYSLVFFIGGSAEPFASTTSNLAPTQAGMNVYYRSSSSWKTKINGVEVAFYDDNSDGLIFTEDPLAYGYKSRLHGEGPKKEADVPVYDSMKIGKKRKAVTVPFSPVAKIGDKWYFMKLADKGAAVEAKPLHPEFFKTGTVVMKWKGSRAVKPQFVIIRGKDSLQAAAFNIAQPKGVEVPAGEYYIAYGRAAKGRGAQTQMVHIFRGSSEPIKVEAGKATEVKMGGPFKLDFTKAGDEDEVSVDSLYFQVKGISGAVYGKIQGPTPAPEVVVAKSSSGKGAKVVGSYIPISSPEMLNIASETLTKVLAASDTRSMGVNVGYFPVVKGDKAFSTVLKFKPPFPGALVGLRVKKHKMFGKIEPIFK